MLQKREAHSIIAVGGATTMVRILSEYNSWMHASRAAGHSSKVERKVSHGNDLYPWPSLLKIDPLPKFLTITLHMGMFFFS